MTPKWPRDALALLAVCAVAACGASDPAEAEKCGEPLRAEPGELRTALADSWFDADALLGDAAALPDGSVLVTYDTNPDEAGDADNLAGEKEEPGLVVLAQDGSCEPFDPPEVDGRRLGVDASPVAVDDKAGSTSGTVPASAWCVAVSTVRGRPLRRSPATT